MVDYGNRIILLRDWIKEFFTTEITGNFQLAFYANKGKPKLRITYNQVVYTIDFYKAYSGEDDNYDNFYAIYCEKTSLFETTQFKIYAITDTFSLDLFENFIQPILSELKFNIELVTKAKGDNIYDLYEVIKK